MLRDPQILDGVPPGGWTPAEASSNLKISLRTVYAWLAQHPPARRGRRWLLQRDYLAERLGLLAAPSGAPPLDLQADFFQTCRRVEREDSKDVCVLDDWQLRSRPDLLSNLSRELAALISRTLRRSDLDLVPGNTRDRGAYACPCVQLFTKSHALFPVRGDRGVVALYPRPNWDRAGERPALVYVDACFGSGESLIETHKLVCQWVQDILPTPRNPVWSVPHIAAIAVFYCNDPERKSFHVPGQKEAVPILRLVTCPNGKQVCKLRPWGRLRPAVPRHAHAG